MRLPRVFEQRLQTWLGPEWSDFEASLHLPSVRGIRLHRTDTQLAVTTNNDGHLLSVGAPRLPIPAVIHDALMDKVPWFPDGYYLANDVSLGKHIFHEMGLFYLQEPSAMAPVAALVPKPGETILDLCAAPGGKTSGIGALMHGEGLFIANEIHPKRVVVLAQNMERLGLFPIVTNASPTDLAQAFPGYFDAILMDAPCSGEGMFRKDPAAIDEWSEQGVLHCRDRQQWIAEAAIAMLKPGGRLVYSTCTFNPVENEQMIEWLMETYGMDIDPLPDWPGWSAARSDWTLHGTDLSFARRLWPHQGRGEGHFVCRLVKRFDDDRNKVTKADQPTAKRAHRGGGFDGRLAAGPLNEWSKFIHSIVKDPPSSWVNPTVFGGIVYPAVLSAIPPTNIRVLRPGLALAALQGSRFEPHHHLAMSLSHSSAVQSLSISHGEVKRYLAGESIPSHGEHGWTWVHHAGYPVGWGKAVESRVNNAYPKGLRKTGLLDDTSPQSPS